MMFRKGGGALRHRAPAIAATSFVVVSWLAAVCNVEALCGRLDGATAILAVAYLAAYRAASSAPFAVLGRRGASLLAVTSGVTVVAAALQAVAPGRFGWLAGSLEVVAWAWVLWTSVAAGRWLAGETPAPDGREPRRMAPRHLLVSAVIVVVVALQIRALFRPRPTWWPFIDYPLYSAAHREPIRTAHHRMYGLTANEPVEFFELTAERLGVSWFVYHTQTIPRLFNRPSGVLDRFQRTLARADLPPLQMLMPVRETFALVDSEIQEFVERRIVPLDPPAITPTP